MKAHIPANKRLSQKSKKIVEEYSQKCEEDRLRRLLKLCCVVLNEDFGFGQQRLLKFIFKVESLATDTDEVFWHHIDRKLIQQLKIPFERDR